MSESSKSPAIVIGGGIVGLTAALELQRHGYNVTIMDGRRPEKPNTSTVAGAQFLPYVHCDDMKTEDRAAMLAMAEKTRDFYTQLAKYPDITGVMPIGNVEPVNDAINWAPELVATMRAKSYNWPVSLPGGQQETQTYDRYYEFASFSIHTETTLEYLLAQFEEAGGIIQRRWINRRQMGQLKLPIIQAAGVGALGLTNDETCQLVKGYSVVYRPRRRLPVQPIISVDDLLIMPRQDGTVVGGALYIEDYHSTGVEAAEVDPLLKRLKMLGTCAVGSFEGWPEDVFDDENIVAIRTGLRVVSPTGPIIRDDPEFPHVVHNYAYGSVGWSTKDGGAELAVRRVIERARAA